MPSPAPSLISLAISRAARYRVLLVVCASALLLGGGQQLIAARAGAANPRAKGTSSAKASSAPSKTSPLAKKVSPALNPSKPAPALASAPYRTPLERLGAPPAALDADPSLKDASLVVDYSSDWFGYLEPCG